MEIVIVWLGVACLYGAIQLWRFGSRQISAYRHRTSARPGRVWRCLKWFLLYLFVNAFVLTLLERLGAPSKDLDVQNTVLVVVACGFGLGYVLGKLKTRALRRRAERASNLARENEEQERKRRAVDEFNVRKQADAVRKRKEDARARVEIFFNLHAPELGARFTRAMFDEFVGRYLTDTRSPEDVEARAEQLTQVIRQHLAKAKPWAELQSLDEIISTYAARRKKVQESEIDPRDRENLLIQLDEQQERDVARALREGRI